MVIEGNVRKNGDSACESLAQTMLNQFYFIYRRLVQMQLRAHKKIVI